jgi:hypothetical protein
MKRMLPISLIWLTVGASLLELLAQLQLVLLDLKSFLEIAVVVLFVISVLTARRQFVQDSRVILDEIQTWEEDMKRDIAQFLQARKTRLLTSLMIVGGLLILKLILAQMENLAQLKEPLQYIFVIVLFHGSLISSLILFKVNRTISWIRHENILARQETE